MNGGLRRSKCIIIVLVIIIPCTLFAAGVAKDSTAKRESKISIGFSVGPNLTQIARKFYKTPLLNEGYSSEGKPKLSFAGGLFLQYNFTKSSSLHMEVLYERKGLKDTYYENPYGIHNSNSKYYIFFERLAIPLYYRATFNKLFIDIGAFAGYAMGNISVLKQPSAPNPLKTKYEVQQPLFKGASAGIGYCFVNNKSCSFSFEFRDEYELTNKGSFNGTNIFSLNTINLLWAIAFKL